MARSCGNRFSQFEIVTEIQTMGLKLLSLRLSLYTTLDLQGGALAGFQRTPRYPSQKKYLLPCGLLVWESCISSYVYHSPSCLSGYTLNATLFGALL
jgi:hypothetical protein